ncbi:hypothetical protein ABT084_27700 [Streptomyces sp. NPDC002138]|uniref:hypothetical protein n=1 Tax=Streptomyces sp. NPDC002138 TaxID=3154410 RepID=UPI0033226B02
MTVRRRAAAALAVAAVGTALLLTGCAPDTSARPASEQSADKAKQAEMQQKLDDADKAAADADSDAAQNN